MSARRRRPQFSRPLRGELTRRHLGLIIAAVLIGIAILVPRYFPNARRGVLCTDLAAPIGGNNRSVLAFRSEQKDALKLEISLESDQITLGEPLVVRLTFVNTDSGPLILHIPDRPPILTGNDAVQGVTLQITSVGGAVALRDQPDTYSPPPYFPDQVGLHLLGARARCHQTYRISAATLQGIGVQPGEYRIRAFYRNTSAGNLLAVMPPDATATPFPQYVNDQGVWVGEAVSGEIRFTVLPPAPPTFAPQ